MSSSDISYYVLLCFVDLELLQRTLSCINTNSFCILDWPGTFPDLIPMEEVWNCLTINLAHYGILFRGTNHETVI